MGTAEATSQTIAPVSSKPAKVSDDATGNVFLIRGLIAIVWAGAFAVASDSLTTSVTVGAGILLVLYPLIDVIGSLSDAQSQRGSARHLLLANAAASAIAAVGLGVAATGSVGDVLAVFGVWAFITGAAQLVVALRRRALLGNQVPLLLAGAGSTIFGIVFLVMSGADDPMPEMIAVYAAGGGIEFVIQAWLLARRRRRLVTRPT